MKKIVIIAVFMILSVTIASELCHCQNNYDSSDEDLRVFDGKVVNVDTYKSILTVKGVGQIDFPITSDTSIQSDLYDIKLSDIDLGDYVTVQYYRSGSESRSPMKVLIVTVENKPEV